jgi:methyl-accepting chemotaxis protein
MWSRQKEKNIVMQEAASIMESTHQLLEGNLDIGINTEAYLSLEGLAQDINRIGSNFRDYINEISRVLTHLSAGNMTVSFTKEITYHGDFLPIKNALHKIRHSLHSSLEEINQLSSHLDQFCNQVEQGAVQIAKNNAEQSELINELTARIYQITEQTMSNAKNAATASDNVQKVQNEAMVGRSYMDEMLSSIQRVKLSSNDISHVIDIINGLSAQTRLLALNASIEAARAGEAGAGFSVVAKEIGDLAQKSADAVKKTTELIHHSISTVDDSVEITEKATNSFMTIQSSIDHITRLCAEIAKASESQAEELESTTEIITEISGAVQNNAAFAEENSALATDMAEASAQLKRLMNRFKLKSNPEQWEGRASSDNVKSVSEEQNIKDLIEQLKKCSKVNEMDLLLTEILQQHKDFECLYIIDEQGYQLSHTIMNQDIIIEQEENFKPAMPGDYHGTKKYFRKAVKAVESWYISDEYISTATGGLCRTHSCAYRGEDQQLYILCVDVISLL